MSEQFEDFVTALASGSSRRAALRRLAIGAAAAVVASLPGLSAPKAASADFPEQGKIGINGALIHIFNTPAKCKPAGEQLLQKLSVNGTIFCPKG